MDRESRVSRVVKAWILGGLVAAFGLFSHPAAANNLADKKATDILPGGTKKKRKLPRDIDGPLSVAWTISTGGSLNTGNTQSYAWSAGTDLELFAGRNIFSFYAIANLEGVNAKPSNPDSPYETTTKKIFAVAQYNYFFTRMNAFWASMTQRWDPFAGYNTEFIAAGGYLRAFIREDDQNLSARVGYAFTYDIYSSEATTTKPNSSIHGLIAALDYEIQANEKVQFLFGAAYIINMNRIEAQDADAFKDNRVSTVAAFIANFADRFDIEARFLLLFDSNPPAEFTTDTTTLINLIYTLY